MANIPAFVGVPKRASCNRCSNPIFLAERISFGARSYHRSCLKCARCGTQLTVGSFYETETDGEYCCETCPDEELQLTQRRESSVSSEGSHSSSSVTGGAPVPLVVPVTGGLPRTVRSSKLLDRISFFESSAPLSDEEKTSNLERKSRMSSFLKGTLVVDGEPKQDKPPDLPKTAPPDAVHASTKERKQSVTEPVEVVEEKELDVEDEFEKLVQGLDYDEPVETDVKGSLQSISDEVKEQQTTEPPAPVVLPLVEVVNAELSNPDETTASPTTLDKDPVELQNIVVVVDTVEETENTTREEEKPSIEQTVEYPDEELDEQITIVIPPSNIEISIDASKDSGKEQEERTEEIVDEEKRSSTPPPPPPPPSSELVPSVIESIVPEEKESTDTNVLPQRDEPVASTEPNVLPVVEPVASANEPMEPTKPEELAASAGELQLLPKDAAIGGEEQETVVPEDDKTIAPLLASGTKDAKEEADDTPTPVVVQSPASDEEQYPSDLNPFGDEDDAEGNEKVGEVRKTPAAGKPVPTARHVSTNPFGSEDEDEDTPQSPSSKPPRPPPPKVKASGVAASTPPVPANPFGDGDDDDGDDDAQSEEPDIVPIVSKPSPRRTPVPTPRRAHAYNDSVSSLENSLMSSSRLSSSNVSLASSLESGPSSMVVQRRKKGKAPDVPVPLGGAATASPLQLPTVVSSGAEKMSQENLSNSSGSGTLTTPRKKRLAPPPPPGSSSTPKQSPLVASAPPPPPPSSSGGLTRAPSQRLLTLDASLIGHESSTDPVSRAPSDESVVYRRTIVPLVLDEDGPESPMHGSTNATSTSTSERQWEKMKDNKEAQNRNRQSQSSPISEGNGSSLGSGSLSILANKSSQGKWKRRKGPAPALPQNAAPMPERKPIKMLPLKEIHQELQIIETQQQGLEKQGIVLEKMIRERCEGIEADVDLDIRLQTNSKEVEDLIMQLFELVNEKNELFRRQAELMYLRRMHRLEQEQADLEYEIRLLMAQPERNKTDSDKEKEEALIARLVEIVQLRNEVVECLEMDRIREAEEDLSIKQSIEERAASQQSKHSSSKKDSSTNSSTLPLTDAEKRDSSTKLSKKEKKKLKEAKKLVKSKKIDSEKDADETESSTVKEKKKKRKFLF